MMMMTCKQRWITAGLAGAAVKTLGLDTTLQARGAPDWAHWGLAGFAVEAVCKGPSLDYETMMAVMAGAAGGDAAGYLPSLKLM